MFFKKRPKIDAPIIHAMDGDFDTLVAEPGIAIVDFWAAWCAPCRMMMPILDEVAIEWADVGVRVIKVDVDQAKNTAERFGIRSIPTLMFFEDGEPLFEMVGLVAKPVLEREIGELLNTDTKTSGATEAEIE
jgi:thioredoxin 1